MGTRKLADLVGRTIITAELVSFYDSEPDEWGDVLLLGLDDGRTIRVDGTNDGGIGLEVNRE
jgi:hypothetical protein